MTVPEFIKISDVMNLLSPFGVTEPQINEINLDYKKYIDELLKRPYPVNPERFSLDFFFAQKIAERTIDSEPKLGEIEKDKEFVIEEGENKALQPEADTHITASILKLQKRVAANKIANSLLDKGTKFLVDSYLAEDSISSK